MHKDDIIAQVVDKVKRLVCPSCDVKLDQDVDTSCTLSDEDTATFQFTLVSSDPLNLQSSNAISLMIEGNVTAQLCSNDCVTSTIPSPPPGDSTVVVAVVVAVLITVLVVLLVLVSTFTLRKLSSGIW